MSATPDAPSATCSAKSGAESCRMVRTRHAVATPSSVVAFIASSRVRTSIAIASAQREAHLHARREVGRARAGGELHVGLLVVARAGGHAAEVGARARGG